eukprot:3934281-Rhodomonas_salina.1
MAVKFTTAGSRPIQAGSDRSEEHADASGLPQQNFPQPPPSRRVRQRGYVRGCEGERMNRFCRGEIEQAVLVTLTGDVAALAEHDR